MAPQYQQRKRQAATNSSTIDEYGKEHVVGYPAKLAHRVRPKLSRGSYVVKPLKGNEAFEAAVAAGIFTPTGCLAKAYTNAQTRARRSLP